MWNGGLPNRARIDCPVNENSNVDSSSCRNPVADPQCHADQCSLDYTSDDMRPVGERIAPNGDVVNPHVEVSPIQGYEH